MAKKTRLPKKVVGVRIPKAIRKNAVVTALLSSETGRRILGQALVAGAAAAAAVLTANSETASDAAGKGARKAKKSGNIAIRALSDAAGAMTGVIADAAKSITPDDSTDIRRPSSRVKRVAH